MPDATQNMSLIQDSDGSAETPDRSLGSLSLTATGEQLDDMQLDRMYLESPAPSSFIQVGGDGPLNISGVGMSLSGLRRNPRQPLQTITANQSSAADRSEPLQNPVLDPDSFDRLSLIDLSEVSEVVEGDNWLSEVPTDLPPEFSEDDRSFLDTNLLNKRFFLLNYVTRVINEEIYTETKNNAPVSSISNLINEPAGSAATFKVTRPHAKSHPTAGPSRYAGGATSAHNGDSQGNNYMASTIEEDTSLITSNSDHSPIQQAEEEDQNPPIIELYPPKVDAGIARGISSGSLTFRRPQMRRQGNVSLNGQANGAQPNGSFTINAIEQLPDDAIPVAENITYTHLGNRTIRLSHGPGGPRRGSGSYASPGIDFVPDNLSPVGPSPTSRFLPVGARNGTRTLIVHNGGYSDDNGEGEPAPLNELRPNEASTHLGQNAREIDTRTYTRPKKTRMSLGTPHRQMNTTTSLSPLRPVYPEAQQALNTTMNLSHHSPMLGTPNRQLNTTIDLSPEHSMLVASSTGTPNHQLNTTIELPSEKSAPTGAPGSPSVNLNETFVAENESPSERARRVTRNLSYVIRREDEVSSNNNSSPLRSDASPKPDLNNTFSYDADTEGDASAARGSQNTSMEDLNSRVASQIRSLGCSTISRGRQSDQGLSRVNLDETRLVARTSSTDTYSVAHSSESPTSSGLSSPMDTQSYDDIQTSESVRRSMPNLAVIRSATTTRSNLVFPQAGGGQLRKNHYISDSRLSRLGSSDRPRLSVHPSDSAHNSTYSRTLRASEMGHQRNDTERNTSTPASLNRISSAVGPAASRVQSASTLTQPRTHRMDSSHGRTQGSVGNVRSTGLLPPRFSGASATGSGLRPPRPTATSALPQSTASRASAIPGIPVPTRPQSRIPGPGQMRFSRPHSSASHRIMGASKAGQGQKGPVDDWRDGCY